MHHGAQPVESEAERNHAAYLAQQEEREKRHEEYLERQANKERKHEEYLERQRVKEIKHAEYLERQEAREQRHAEYLERQAARDARQREWEREQAERERAYRERCIAREERAASSLQSLNHFLVQRAGRIDRSRIERQQRTPSPPRRVDPVAEQYAQLRRERNDAWATYQYNFNHSSETSVDWTGEHERARVDECDRRLESFRRSNPSCR